MDKKFFEQRDRAAAKRNGLTREAAIANGMAEELADTLCELAALRHRVHTDRARVMQCGSSELDAIAEIETRIGQSFGAEDFCPMEVEEDAAIALGEMPEDDEERAAWREDLTDQKNSELATLNDRIEAYLYEIDQQYHTNFCPSGWLRMQ